MLWWRSIPTAIQSPLPKRLGVDAHMATWPDFNDGQFDAVLFTRSLHHIHPLDESVGRAAESLSEGGRIIVEDFAYDSVDEKTLHWFRSAIRLLEAAGLLIAGDEFLEKVLSKTETLNAWRLNHDMSCTRLLTSERNLRKFSAA
jgi:SAM-dependent methyltransferase